MFTDVQFQKMTNGQSASMGHDSSWLRTGVRGDERAFAAEQMAMHWPPRRAEARSCLIELAGLNADEFRTLRS